MEAEKKVKYVIIGKSDVFFYIFILKTSSL